MALDSTIKKYPVTTSEVAKMLGIQGVAKDLPLGTFADSHSDLPIANLPIASKTAFSAHNLNLNPNPAPTHADSAEASSNAHSGTPVAPATHGQTSQLVTIVKNV